MAKTTRMRAVEISEHGGLRRTTRAVLDPGPSEVRLRVVAAALTAGEEAWPDDLPVIPAHDVVGVVEAVGDDVSRFAVDDRVFGVVPFDRDGALAEHVVAPESVLATAPRSLTSTDAVVLPLGALSAWQALVDVGGLRRGSRVLVLGGAGGVGAYAVQLAALLGGEVTATCRASDEVLVRSFGATDVADYADKVPPGPFDIVVDTVGGDAASAALRRVAQGGQLASLAGPIEDAGEVDAVYFVVSPDGARTADIARLADDGVLRPAPHRVLAFGDPALLDRPSGRPSKTAVVVQEEDHI